jgi:predicted RNA-binding protein with RPS1 domain
MLSDLPGTNPGEIALVLNAVDARVPGKLLDSRGTPGPLLQAQLAQDLEMSMFLAGPVARWAVQTWAFALGPAPGGPAAAADPPSPGLGERFFGTVVKVAVFGAFVSLPAGKDGLLHVTQIRKLHGGKRIDDVGDVIRVGDVIEVEINEIDDRRRPSLVPVAVIEREAAGRQPGDVNHAGHPVARLWRRPRG